MGHAPCTPGLRGGHGSCSARRRQEPRPPLRPAEQGSRPPALRCLVRLFAALGSPLPSRPTVTDARVDFVVLASLAHSRPAAPGRRRSVCGALSMLICTGGTSAAQDATGLSDPGDQSAREVRRQRYKRTSLQSQPPKHFPMNTNHALKVDEATYTAGPRSSLQKGEPFEREPD